MVTNEARWILTNTKVDPLEVAKVWGIPEEECWDYIYLYNQALSTAEKAHDALQTQKMVHEWLNTIPEKDDVKKAVLLEKLNIAKVNPTKYDIKRLLWEVSVFTGKTEKITPDMIERAKGYPIYQLLNVSRKGNISCPFHKDKNPSFQITKKNTFTCYSCGQYGDSIDLYQKLHNVSLKEAVNALCA